MGLGLGLGLGSGLGLGPGLGSGLGSGLVQCAPHAAELSQRVRRNCRCLSHSSRVGSGTGRAERIVATWLR